MILDVETCPDGQYYCFDDKKCKPIPKGKKVGKGGMLETTSLKNEIIARAQKRHTMAKGKNSRMSWQREKNQKKNCIKLPEKKAYVSMTRKVLVT